MFSNNAFDGQPAIQHDSMKSGKPSAAKQPKIHQVDMDEIPTHGSNLTSRRTIFNEQQQKLQAAAQRRPSSKGEIKKCSLCQIRRADLLFATCGHCFHARCLWKVPLSACPVCNVAIVQGSVSILPIENHFEHLRGRDLNGKPGQLRQGRWHLHELMYAEEVIKLFMSGDLKVAENTKLCPFLCNLLLCSAERLSKKMKLGKKYFRENRDRVTDVPTMKSYFEGQRRLSEIEELFLQEEIESQHNPEEVENLSARMQQTWRDQFIAYAKDVGQPIQNSLNWMKGVDESENTKLHSITAAVIKMQEDQQKAQANSLQNVPHPNNFQTIHAAHRPMPRPVLLGGGSGSRMPAGFFGQDGVGLVPGLAQALVVDKGPGKRMRVDTFTSVDSLDLDVFDFPEDSAQADHLGLDDYQDILSPSTLALIQSDQPINSTFFPMAPQLAHGTHPQAPRQMMVGPQLPGAQAMGSDNYVGFGAVVPKPEPAPSASVPFESFVRAFLDTLPQFDCVDVWVPSMRAPPCPRPPAGELGGERPGGEVVLCHGGSVEKAPHLRGWAAFSQQFEFQDNVGLIGRVVGQNRCEWQQDVGSMLPYEFLRCEGARSFGLRTAFGIPIRSERGAKFVVCFYSTQRFARREEVARYLEGSVQSWKFSSSLEEEAGAPAGPPHPHVDCKIEPGSQSPENSSHDGKIEELDGC